MTTGRKNGLLLVGAVLFAACLVAVMVWVLQRDQSTATPVCLYKRSVPAFSPDCVPGPPPPGRIAQVPLLPASGPCSIKAARALPPASIDFQRYINNDFIVNPAWYFRIEQEFIVSLPTGAYDVIQVVSPEAPKPPAVMYRITGKSFGSLVESIPSLQATMANVGMAAGAEFYLTSPRCLPIGSMIK